MGVGYIFGLTDCEEWVKPMINSKFAALINIIMRKSMLLFLVLTSCVAVAQTETKPVPDTIHRSSDSTLVSDLKDNLLDNIPVVSLDENDLNDASSQNVSSVLTAGRDPYFNAASFNFNAVRFRIRGYDADMFSTYMNGIPMDNLDNGFTPWGLWGGLNDVMRNRDLSLGLRPNTFAFGDIGSTTNIDARASKQRKQTSVGYAISNRNYDHRMNLTHSTGLSKTGWAFTAAGSRRFADEGYIPGTYYNSNSYYLAVDKRFNNKNMLSLAVFGAPTENGRQGSSIVESQDLAGDHYYNPAWGYQNGKKRNANVGKTHQPYIILTHDLRFNNNTSLSTAFGYSFGERSGTGIDWYNAADPRPDYYRYLPSYQEDPNMAAQVAEKWRTDPSVRQINWDRFYDANRSSFETVKDVNGIIGNNVSGRRSHYIIEDRVINTNRISFNSVINTRVGDHIDITGGVVYQMQNNNYFKRVEDLLGGEFYVDLNQFAERDFPSNTTANQNNIDKPNRILKVGDKFGYDYDINIQKASSFVQSVLKFNKFDVFGAIEYSRTSFFRKGNVKNGLYPENSFGKSTANNFNNYAFKGGATYKMNGRNYFYVNGSVMTRAPLFDNAYISPRTRDALQDGISSERIQSIEYGYIHTSPNLKLRASGYYTRFKNGFNVISGYSDEFNTFVNYALSNIDKNHFGGEFGIEYRLTPTLTFNGAAGIGRYYFSSRQNMNVTVDNTNKVISSGVVNSKNFKIASTPHEAYTAGLSYRSPNFWFVTLSANYFDQMFLEFNPLRRITNAIDGLDITKPDDFIKYRDIVYQTDWKSQYTIDFFGGYSWRLPKSLSIADRSFIAFNVGVNNITNNKNIITGGFEQLRIDNEDVNKFPPKLFYAYGINYFASVTYRF